MGQGARIRNQGAILHFHGKMTALLCVQQQICTSRRLCSCMRQLIYFCFPKSTLADVLWQCGLHSTWQWVKIPMISCCSCPLAVWPLGSWAYRFSHCLALHRLVRSQNWVWPRLVQKAGMQNQNHCLSYFHCCWDKLTHKKTLLKLKGSIWPLLSQFRAIWPEASHLCLSVPMLPNHFRTDW